MTIKLTVFEPDKEMKIKIKDLNTASMELAGNGLELEFREADGKHTGDLLSRLPNSFGTRVRNLSLGNQLTGPSFSS
ncbi:MAG: hypothetical protein ACR2HX_07625 [Pyrinomonadaceae bacterium]